MSEVRSLKFAAAFAAGVFFAATSLYAAPQPAAGELQELEIRDHQRGSVKFETDGAFSALVMFKPEIAMPCGGEQRLLMSVGNGYNCGFCITLQPDGLSGKYHPQLAIAQNGRLRGGLYVRSCMEAPVGTVQAGRWQRVAATWDGNTARIYVDGREVVSGVFAEPYIPASDKQAVVGASGESQGKRSLPFVVERAAVCPKALPPEVIAQWASDTTPFEPDTPEFPLALVRAERGENVSVSELDALRTASFHTPLALLALDRAKTCSLIREGRFAEADRLAADVELRLGKIPRSSLMVAGFRSMLGGLKMSCSPTEKLIVDAHADYAKARAENAGHLPYVALTLAKALERAGKNDKAALVRDKIRKMDLRRFPHLAEELGLKGEYTAHHEKGAAVSMTMPKTAFYVSPDGDDAADGSAMHPFKTLARAREAVRALKAKGLPSGGVAVRIRGGTYRMEETLELSGEADSGTPDRPIVWCADGDDLPVFDGGFDVPMLKPVTDPAALARIPAAARGNVLCCDVRSAGYKHTGRPEPYGRHREAVVPITDLFQDGERLTPARYPNDGWLKVEDFSSPTGSWFKTSLEDFRPWAAEHDLMATGFWLWYWADYTTPVTNVDVSAGMLALDMKKLHKEGFPRGNYVPFRQGQEFFLLNALCALDAPGEWYLDSRSGVLYVWPRGGELCAKFTLTSFTGPFLRAKNIHDVRIEGMVFQNGRLNGVVLTDCHDVAFAGNVVRRFGGIGMNARRMTDTTIRDNVFRSFGHGALDVSGGVRKTLTHSGIVISNNEFYDIGNRRRTYAPHLELAGVGAEVSFNHFHKSPSSAMRLEGNDFNIVSNLVEDVLLESDDQGAVDIYFNSSFFGNRYCYNTWKNIGRQTDKLLCGQAAVRFDGNISGQTVVGNRFLNCGTGGFGAIQSCGGRLHVIDNNLFVNCNRGMSITNYETNFWFKTIRPTLIKPCLVDVCITNAPYATRYPGIADLLWTNQVNHLVRNVTVGTPLLVNPPVPTVSYGNYSFAEMPDLGALARDTAWSLIPKESDTGPRQTPAFIRAKHMDEKQ